MNKGKIMRKLLGQPTTTSNESHDTSSNFGDSPQISLRPSASQNTVYSARAPIACLDRSPDGQRAVVAGAKVFKTLRVDGSTITDDIDLRSIISTYASTHDASAATADQFNIRAVKWSHSELDTTIMTACGNGRITLYDLNRINEGLEVLRIQEHVRQVHKLAISPFKCNWLLSASQDGTVKLFDIKAPSQRNAPSFKSPQTFKCNADAVRDVKWSPTDGFEFACSTDSGAILKWDIRKANNPVLKITAHHSACFSISWHPDGEYLISGGIDQQCKVWDVSKKAESRQKPRYTFTTPAPVSHVSWRPPCWSATAQAKRAAQVTVAYDESNATRNQTAAVHIWDLARSTMPFKEIEQWNSAPTGLLWNTRDLLWSVDKDGHFTQTDAHFVSQLIDHRSLSSFKFSTNGDILMLLEQRQSPRRHRPSINSPDVSPSYQHKANGPLMSVSRSDSEEDVVGSFLGPRQRKSHRRRHSGRSTQGLSTTPPNITGMAEHLTLSLDEAVKITGLYKSQQVMAFGHAPSTAKRATYQHFSNRYLERLAEKELHNPRPQVVNDQLTSTMEFFAKSAEAVGHYRLAQTWRLLSYTMNLLLVRRAENHRQSRLTRQQGPNPRTKTKEEKKMSRYQRGEHTPRRWTRANTPSDSPRHQATRHTSDEIESTSNVATPLVRPQRDTIAHETPEAMHASLLADDVLELPQAAQSTSPSPIPVPRSSQLSDQSASSVEGYDFYGMESFSPALDFVAPPRKQPLRLDYADHKESKHRIQPQRHDSEESFQMFSTSAESSKFMSSGESEVQSLQKDASRALRDRYSSWENNFQSREKRRASINSGAPGQSEASDEIASLNEKRGVKISMPNHPQPPPILRIQEASVVSAVGTDPVKKPVTKGEEAIPSSPEKVSSDPNIIPSDFAPWPNDPHFTIMPIDPTILVQRAIDFESQTGCLNASSMILLLRPLLPPKAIDEIQTNAILRQYHQRLISMMLFNEATLLRNLCVPTYPSVFAPAQENVAIGYFCTDCHKSLENDPLIPGSVWRCPRCRQAMDGCAVCKQRDMDSSLSYEGEPIDSPIWFLCPGCGHGGHTACMATWHSGPEFEEGSAHSGGSCPLEGCLHPCLPGTWRERREAEKKAMKDREMDLLVRENARNSGGAARGGVRRDKREVSQSRAVEGVRVALGISGGGLERKKSVKVVAPGEEKGSK